jgi:hypothetical protein
MNYEVSSKGDKRFSAFYAILPDGRSIEHHYQCDVKGYCPGGRNWKLGKGKPPLDKSVDTVRKYRALWWKYLKANPDLADFIKEKLANGAKLTDSFAKGAINQADAITWLWQNGHI